MPTRVVVDFDSTIVQVESLDELARIALKSAPDKADRLAKIQKLTELGMAGKLGFGEALSQRLALFAATQDDIDELVALLKQRVTPSFREYVDEMRGEVADLYVVSGGFKEFIVPVVEQFGIDPEHVLANTFTFGKDGRINGCDQDNPLASDGGKVKALEQLSLMGRIVIVGDGFSDLQVEQAGAAKTFLAFTENVSRAQVLAEVLPEHEVEDFGDVVSYLRATKHSFPKQRMNVLLLENIHPDGIARLEAEGYQVTCEAGSLSEAELVKRIGDVSILGIRSNTKVTAEVLKAGKRLLAVGAFCIGTNQIDLKAAAEHGVAVFNAPFSNTRSVVELAVAEIIALNRRLTDKNAQMHAGMWDKSATGNHEVRGRKLGIVGYGNIGAQLSVIAEALGMEVIYYDVAEKLAFGNARPVNSLDELLRESDVVTMHVDGRGSNKGLIGEEQFAAMKPGALFLNLSRGMVVDTSALKRHLESGHLAGAALDVFPAEPKSKGMPFDNELIGMPNVILTPHVASGTEEAQANIGRFVADKLIGFVNEGSTALSVNLPSLMLPPQEGSHRFVLIHRNVPGVLARINSLFGERGINIDGQYLGTRAEIGYVITDINSNDGDEIVAAMRALPETIRLRTLY